MLTSFARLRAVDPGFTVHERRARCACRCRRRATTTRRRRASTRNCSSGCATNPVTARSGARFPDAVRRRQRRWRLHRRGRAAASRAPSGRSRSSARSRRATSRRWGFRCCEAATSRSRDTRERPGVVVVNQTLADREWPGQDPIGKRVAIGGDPNDPALVDHGRRRRRRLQARRPADRRRNRRSTCRTRSFTLPFMARGRAERRGRSGRRQRRARRGRTSSDPELPIGDVADPGTHARARHGPAAIPRAPDRRRSRPRRCSSRRSVFTVSSATPSPSASPEIGVRLALGATPAQVGRLILGQGLALAAAGVGLGLAGALAATRLLEGLLFSVSATDPTVYAALAALAARDCRAGVLCPGAPRDARRSDGRATCRVTRPAVQGRMQEHRTYQRRFVPPRRASASQS